MMEILMLSCLNCFPETPELYIRTSFYVCPQICLRAKQYKDQNQPLKLQEGSRRPRQLVSKPELESSQASMQF